jgi:hypothetical protein
MKKPASVKALEELGRVRLSEHFFMRDFLYSEVSNFYGIPNIPDDPDVAVEVGSNLCKVLLEPLYHHFGAITIVSGYRSCEVNDYCNKNRLNCASNESNYASHIWDHRDAGGNLGATASIVIHSFADRYAEGADWREMAWWIHDHLPYSTLCFFPKLAAFNIQWRENPERTIMSYVEPKGTLTKPGMENFEGDQRALYTSLMAE